MKTRIFDQRKGVAIVLVLSFLVLISVLVVAFFSSVKSELSGAKSYADGTNSKQLADSAVQMVMGIIQQATSGGSSVAWASQSGMIRTYSESAPTPLACYKLYSSDKMVLAGIHLPFDPASDWDTEWAAKPAQFTDLNRPVVDSAGNAVFPILDGNGLKQLNQSASGASTPPYIGYDAGADGKPDIDGFAIDPARANYDASMNAYRIPMPVKWIYVLRDGTLSAADPSSAATATFTSQPKSTSRPSDTNPIVGRIAFWTDDETCKVNINTASEGSYHDYPRAMSNLGAPNSSNQEEVMLGLNQPVAREYQRFPGHPATTSLSAVIKPPVGWTPPGSLPTNWTAANWKTTQWGLQLQKLIPRLLAGGSQGGSVNTLTTAGSANSMISEPIPDRLYSSPEELVFQATLSAAGVRAENDSLISGGGGAVLNKSTLARARFFLTATSRAPDVNLFNQPRVSIWPITIGPGSDTELRTTFDRTIAFCSTIGTEANSRAFYFARQDSTHPTTDLPANETDAGLGRNRTLLEYLRTLLGKKIPGVGGSFSEKYNTHSDMPSVSGSDCDQILTEIFDYIRSTNLADANIALPQNRYTRPMAGLQGGIGQVVPIVDQATGTRGFGRFKTISGASILFIANVDGDDPVCQFVGGVPQALQANAETSQCNAAGVPYNGTTRVPATMLRIQAIFLPQFFDPSVGSTFNFASFKWRVSNLDKIRVNGSPLFASDGGSKTIDFGTIQTAGDNNAAGDQLGVTRVTGNTMVASSIASLGLVSSSINIPKGNGSFAFTSSEDLIVEILSPTNLVLQKVRLQFPDGNFPLPKLAPYNAYANSLAGPPFYNFRYFTASAIFNPQTPNSPIPVGSGGGGRYVNGTYSATNAGVWFTSFDTIRSVGVKHGDVRLVAPQSETSPSGAGSYPFAKVEGVRSSDSSDPTNQYWSSSVRVSGMHSFVTGNQEGYYGTLVGRLVKDAAYAKAGVASTTGDATAAPYGSTLNNLILPPGDARFGKPFSNGALGSFASIPLNGVAAGKSEPWTAGDLQGDFDNAPWDLRDGPFINKADEGDRLTGGSNKYPYNWKNRQGYVNIDSSLFTPNRMVASAVTFGSLPTGVFASRPWQTLLFHHDPTGLHAGNKGRAGDGSVSANMPPDHLLLDLFHMPVVEPYPISEPLSTAGRINMNYQIVPFDYITRGTGISAVLKAEKVIAIEDSKASSYKSYPSGPTNIRFPVDTDETLKGFAARFSTKDIFHTASEICELPIVPQGQTYSTMTTGGASNYWNSRGLTGDNSRERIYATVYPRLTTKSNTYTVHFCVQALKKAQGGDSAEWVENRDVVLSEYRGSQTIERYVDPNNPHIPDYAKERNSNPPSLDSFYNFRVISVKNVTP